MPLGVLVYPCAVLGGGDHDESDEDAEVSLQDDDGDDGVDDDWDDDQGTGLLKRCCWFVIITLMSRETQERCAHSTLL